MHSLLPWIHLRGFIWSEAKEAGRQTRPNFEEVVEREGMRDKIQQMLTSCTSTVLISSFDGRDVCLLHFVSYSSLGTEDTDQIRQAQEEEMGYKILHVIPQKSKNRVYGWALWNLKSHKEWKLLSQGLSLSWCLCVSLHISSVFSWLMCSVYLPTMFVPL